MKTDHSDFQNHGSLSNFRRYRFSQKMYNQILLDSLITLKKRKEKPLEFGKLTKNWFSTHLSQIYLGSPLTAVHWVEICEVGISQSVILSKLHILVNLNRLMLSTKRY